MKMTNYEAETCRQILTTMIKNPMPRKSGVAIAKNLRKLTEELKEFLENRDELIKKYGEVNEDGIISLNVENKNFIEYAKELDPIGQMNCNIDLVKITYDDLPETIAPEQVLALEFMIEDENSIK